MKHALAAAVVSAALAAVVHGQAGDTPESHIAAAKAAAREDWAGIFTTTCGSLDATPAAGRGRGAAGAQATLARDNWHAEPVKVFDNLYFVGMTEYSAWAITTSQGIILLDAIYDYSIEAEVELRRKAAQNIVTWCRTGRPDYPVVRGTRKLQAT